MTITAHFDEFADQYDAHLNSALAVTGEDKEYFANARLQYLRRKLQSLGENPHTILDYGCGTGDTCRLLAAMPNVKAVEGVDLSPRSIEIAKQNGAECSFFAIADYVPRGDLDLTYCNGVFHHIPVAGRAAAVEYVYRSLRPGGLFAFWENNPWNPATRFIMSRCAFDDDAVPLSPPESCSLLRTGRFQILSVDYHFFFPRFLRKLRPIESLLSKFPLGGQYQILCRKPS